MRSLAPEMTYSRSVTLRSRGGRWSCSATRVPFSNASSPPCFSVSPASIRKSVVFPAPFGPESATRSRRSTLKETPSKRTEPAISLRRFEAITTAISVRVGPMTRQLTVWLVWIAMTIVVLWLIIGLAVTAGPFVAAVIVGPALVVYAYGDQRARGRGSRVWRRSWAASALFLAAFVLVGWLAILAALVVGA